MTLLHAGFLVAGISAAAIPILIHLLFRRRRPPIDWAAMDILLEALRQQERRLRLEQMLLLAARCLLFALAGLALARPVLEGTGLLRSQTRRAVTIVLDDGVASHQRSSAADPSSSAFTRLRSEAAELARSLPTGDRVAVVLASRPARGLVVPATTDREAAARVIESLEPGWGATEFAAALAIAGASEGDESGVAPSERVVVVLSDFRLGSLDPAAPPPLPVGGGERPPTILLAPPATEEADTIAIASMETQRSIDDDSVSVTVRLERIGGNHPAAAVRVELEGEGFAPIAAKTVRWEPGQASAHVEFVARSAGAGNEAAAGALVARIDPDAMPADDTRYAWFDPRSATRIGVVARRGVAAGGDIEHVPASRWLSRALAPTEQPGVEVIEIEPASLDGRTLRDLDAVLLPRPETIAPAGWTALRTFVDGGGLLIAMPSGDVDAQRWSDSFVSAFGFPWQLAADAPRLEQGLGFAPEQPASAAAGLFASLAAELPDLLRPIEIARRVEVRNASQADVVLALTDGTPFLLAASPSDERGMARGLVVLMTAAPELAWTNLPVKPFMVPFTQELVRRGLARIGGADRLMVGEEPQVALRDAVELFGPGGARVGVDGGATTAALLLPGAWRADDLAGRSVGGLAVNVDLRATRPTAQSSEVVSAWFASAGGVRVAPAQGIASAMQPVRDSLGAAVWLLAALIALGVVETLLARWFSHAASGSAAMSDPGVGTTSLIADRAGAA